MLQVIVVDDDEIVLLVQKKMLQRCSITSHPISFKNGQEALETIKRNNGKNFLILLDINMPVMNGWEFLEKLESLNLKTKVYVIMVTSTIVDDDKIKADNFEMVLGFIEKPITNDKCKQIQAFAELEPFFQRN